MTNTEITEGATVQYTNRKGTVMTGTVLVALMPPSHFPVPQARVKWLNGPAEGMEMLKAHDELTVISK